MHPALKFLLVFVPAVFIGDRLGAMLIKSVVSLSRDRFVEMYEGRSRADVVVIGNSRAADQFPARLMGERIGARVVNLGLGGVSTVISEVLFRDYVEQNGRPRLLVIEPTNLTVEPSAVGDMRLFSAFSPRMERVVSEREPTAYWTQQLFHMFAYNNENLVRVLYGVVKVPEDRHLDGAITPELVRIVRDRASVDLKNFRDNEAALERILRFASEQGIDVAIVASPYLPEQLDNYRNYADWYARVARSAGPRIKVWDYSRLFRDAKYFKDSVHMNVDGSMALLDVMLKDGVFDPIRTPKPRVQSSLAR